MTWSLWGSHQGMSMSIMEEKPWYCQTHQSGVDIPALTLIALRASQNAGKDSQVDVYLPCTLPHGRIHSL